jgi:hypothetical protein
MRGKRSKWIKKVVISKDPTILEMIREKFGEEKSNKMTYKSVIRACKKMWNDKTPGIEKWKIYKEEKEQ